MTAAPRARRSRLLVPMIVASQFAQPFMINGVTVALPAIDADLAAGATSLGLIEALFLAGSAAILLPAGRLADASDKATLFKLGLFAFGLSTLLVGMVSSVPLILLLRVLQGAMAATVAVTGPALLADNVPPERRGRVYGAMAGSIYAGMTLGPVVAGFLIDALGWRAVFFVCGAGLIAGGGVAHRVLPSAWRRPAPGSVHLPSAFLVSAAMLLFVFGTASLRAGALGYAMLAAGVAFAVLFVRQQGRVAPPMLDIAMVMRNTALRNALLVQTVLYTNAISTTFLLSIYMQVTLGKPAQLSGQILAVGAILMAVIAPLAGALADRTRPSVIATIGVALAGAGSFLATVLNSDSSLFLVAAALAVQGVGFALFSAPNMAIIMNSVPAGRVSIASALSGTSRQLGMLAGMVLAAALISFYLGDEPANREPLRFLKPMVIAFWCLTALTTVGLAVGLVGSKGRKESP